MLSCKIFSLVIKVICCMDWKKIIVICCMVLLFIDPSWRLIEPKIWIYAGLPQSVAYVGVVCYPLYDVLARHQINRDSKTIIKTITQIFSSKFYFNIFQRHGLCYS